MTGLFIGCTQAKVEEVDSCSSAGSVCFCAPGFSFNGCDYPGVSISAVLVCAGLQHGCRVVMHLSQCCVGVQVCSIGGFVLQCVGSLKCTFIQDTGAILPNIDRLTL